MKGIRWLTSAHARALLWTALVLSLVLGVALVVVDRHEADPLGSFGAPLTDEQAVEQVVGAARGIVTATHVKDPSGGYSFVSCATQNGPPYQVALYMNFSVPHSDWVRYLNEVASQMITDGWADAPAKAEHFGRKLTRGGVTVVLQRNVDDTAFATMRIYGECRNIADHRNDDPAWTKVSL
jgi:hypothetical protein